MAKQRKKRNKKYRPADSGPTLHRYVAEDETKADRRKLWKRRLILAAIVLFPLLLLAWWLF